jgi:hypothetical protein
MFSSVLAARNVAISLLTHFDREEYPRRTTNSGSHSENACDKHRCYAGSDCGPLLAKSLKTLSTGSPARGATNFQIPQDASPFSRALRMRQLLTARTPPYKPR